MESILLKIKRLYPEMGSSERKIADWLTANFQEIIGLSINELATKCGCGEATIVRFSRRLGLSGYQELKLKIAQESANTAQGGVLGVEQSDSCYDIFNKRIRDIAVALENTKTVLSPLEIEKAANIIKDARRIVIFGLGNSASIAVDAQHKFLRAGLDAIAYCDNHMQAIAASHLHKGDVAIGVSHSGASIDVVDALKTAKQTGATTICITNFGESPINKYSDIILNTRSDETKYSILAMSSRIAQLAIFDAIYTYIVMHSNKAAVQAIKDAENALHSKKYIKD
ncbi:MAG: MurR/RpiR family transcriptional regulator [Clostridia bacterium]|nr:MurR/RpiR family transcriptional regulator [Clostridia bacterium]